jgi:predicted dehydrogenase
MEPAMAAAALGKHVLCEIPFEPHAGNIRAFTDSCS